MRIYIGKHNSNCFPIFQIFNSHFSLKQYSIKANSLSFAPDNKPSTPEASPLPLFYIAAEAECK